MGMTFLVSEVLRPGGFDFVIKRRRVNLEKGLRNPNRKNQRLREGRYADYQAWDTERRIF